MQFGWVDVDAMLDSITPEQFSEWLAYDQIQPFGPERDDLRMGISTSALMNLQLDKKSKRIKPMDLMPYTEKPQPKRQTPEEMLNVFKAMTARQKAGTEAVRGEMLRRSTET